MKYEINGIEFETDRSLTDAEMRHLIGLDPGLLYEELVAGDLVNPHEVKPHSFWLNPSSKKILERNLDNTAWVELELPLLSDSDLALVEEYMANKYGITLSLIAS